MATDPVACAPRTVVPDPLAVRRWVEQSCAAQHISVAVSDERTIAHLVALLTVEATGTHPETVIAC